MTVRGTVRAVAWPNRSRTQVPLRSRIGEPLNPNLYTHRFYNLFKKKERTLDNTFVLLFVSKINLLGARQRLFYRLCRRRASSRSRFQRRIRLCSFFLHGGGWALPLSAAYSNIYRMICQKFGGSYAKGSFHYIQGQRQACRESIPLWNARWFR